MQKCYNTEIKNSLMVNALSKISVGDVKETLLPRKKLLDIANFIVERRDLKAAEEIFAEIQAQAAEDETFLGVTSVEEHEGQNGEKLFTVMIAEEYFPPNFELLAGAAFRGKGVAFVKGGFSEPVEKAIRTHEKYHLENGQWSYHPDLHPIIRFTFKQLHEFETILFSNLLVDPISTARTGLEVGLKLPRTIVQFIAHVRTQAAKIMNQTS